MNDTAISASVRVFISYAHGNAEHEEQVRQFWIFLRAQGINARLDRPAAEQPQDWSLWMLREIRAARFVLMIASSEYRRRAEGDNSGDPTRRGVGWEARLIRDEVYADPEAALGRFLSVILPGGSSAGIPAWMGPATTTHYQVSDFTVKGAERLLRLLTDQPYETQPRLGSVPVLPRRADASSAQADEAVRPMLLRRLADRVRPRNEAMVQADVRQLLLIGDLGLNEQDLGVEPGTRAEDRRRIDITTGSAVIEVRADLRANGVLATAERQLANYLAVHRERITLALLTDGGEWRLYRRADDSLEFVTALVIDASQPDADELLMWLESLLATRRDIEPTPREIARKLGANSPAHALDFAELAAIFAKYHDQQAVKVKRGLWATLLTTATGTNFTDDDSLFVNHTLLVVMAEVIAHAVVGIRPDDPRFGAAEIMSGKLFSDAQIQGVVEADFFDWIAEVPEGNRFIKNVARRLARFAWNHIEHDVLKVLYESIIGPQTRHRLGEYYTPDWLSEKIVAECVTDPLNDKVLDASCGSGTFLFHAVRRHLAAADAAGIPGPDAIRGAVAHVLGIDVHPVAVTLARVTYLLAIGMTRLQTDDRPAFTVPVYLGDSLRWGQERTLLSYEGLSIPTNDDHQMFVTAPDFADRLESTDRLRFPDRLVADAGRFDQLVREFADAATRRETGSRIPSCRAIFRRFAILDEEKPTLEQTFRTMCELHDRGRDHIWGYYVRNVARPAWLARPGNRVDVLVGNPPWLAYRYMTHPQQASFRAMCTERRLWAGAALATNQDLSALFVVRCIELYLRPGGRFGYVMPLATLSRRQYAGFRIGGYPVQAQPVRVAFDRPWDLHRIKPAFFPVPPCVVFGHRVDNEAGVAALNQVPEVWSGKFATATASLAQAAESITRTAGERSVDTGPRSSPYAPRFSQGATVVPRFLFVVTDDDTNPFGAGAGRRAVQSRRSANEKKPWKDLPSLRGIVERRFIRPLYLGDSILPFRCLTPLEAVIPWDGQRLLHGADENLDLYPGLANWWRRAEGVWMDNRSSVRLDLEQRLDYHRGLLKQFPTSQSRVVYTKSGTYLTAAIVPDKSAVIDHKLYWAPMRGLDEARYLTAILNSNTITMAVRPLQSRGKFGPRDFDKYVFQLPIPLYDPADSAHRWLVERAEHAERVAAGVDLPTVRFEALRRRVRDALIEDGVAADIDAIVKTLLAP